jgi:hypothetical protein
MTPQIAVVITSLVQYSFSDSRSIALVTMMCYADCKDGNKMLTLCAINSVMQHMRSVFI